VPRKPYGWTLALAIGYTLFTLLAFGAWFLLWLTGSPFRMYAPGFNIALLGPGTLGLWAAVGKAASVRSLLKIHPDLFVVNIPKRGERRAERPRDVSPGMIKLARESRDRTRRIIYYATVPLLGTILLFSLVDFIESGDADDESGSGQHESTDCPPFRDTLAHLKASWNAGDEEALVEMVAPARRAAFRRVLAAKRKKYEWGDRLRPIDRKLGEYYQYDGCPQLAFFFEIEGCLVVKRVRFRLKHLEGEWVLTGVTFLDS